MEKEKDLVVKSLSEKEQVEVMGGYAPITVNPLGQTSPLELETTIPDVKEIIICR